jgi:hypothetical protein
MSNIQSIFFLENFVLLHCLPDINLHHEKHVSIKNIVKVYYLIEIKLIFFIENIIK